MEPLKKANPLGDIRAEMDHAMLTSAFYESPDYKTLIESNDQTVVVGRRGTGKSALFFRLGKYWEKLEKHHLIRIAPEEHEMIGLRAAISKFATRFGLARAGARLAWRYALIMEMASKLFEHYRFGQIKGIETIRHHLSFWRSGNQSLPVKLKAVLTKYLEEQATPEQHVSSLADKLQLTLLEENLKTTLAETKLTFHVLIDKLDEGYEQDHVGIGLIDGFVHAAIDLKQHVENVSVTIFLRDNIFRAIARQDPDYSRNIEGQTLRLHWDEYHLLNMISNRMRQSFHISQEQSLKVWDECTSRDIKGKEGFRRCLRLTLYRPRDLLQLLNSAFYRAAKQGRTVIENEDVDFTAKDISNSRLSDLVKEYEAMFPGLELFCKSFSNRNAELTWADVAQVVDRVYGSENMSPSGRQHLAILDEPEDVMRSLYSIGFLGLKDATTGSFIFCHDGKSPNVEFNESSTLLVHPCYWMALNMTNVMIDSEHAAEIHDEFDIAVSSETPKIRMKRIGQIIARLNQIPEGDEGASDFEQWCEQAISILFASGLRNIELKPNKAATQRRDIVASNHEGSPVWKRILHDYETRQVVFEIKNYHELGATECRQMLSYLSNEYGNVGFIISRSYDESIEKGKELDWAREMYHEHGKTIVKLTARFLSNYLSKARSPQKHDAADLALNGLLDRYRRNYFGLGNSAKPKKLRKSSGNT